MSSVLKKIMSEKLLAGICLDVYKIINSNKNITTGEIWRKYASMNDNGRSRNEIAKRVSDLENWGAIKNVGIRECEVTGRLVKSYEVTGLLPDKTKKPEEKPLEKDYGKIIRDADLELEALRKERRFMNGTIAELRAKLSTKDNFIRVSLALNVAIALVSIAIIFIKR